MATLKKLNWQRIIHQLVEQKNSIQAHYDKGLSPASLQNVKFITPLSLPDNK